VWYTSPKYVVLGGLFERVIRSDSGGGWVYKMEQEDKWLHALKLLKNTTGELSVKSQLIIHHSNKAMTIEWHQLSTCNFDRVGRKKPDLPVLNKIQKGI